MAFTERLALVIDAKAGGAISELNKLNAEINRVNTTQTQATGMTGMFERGLAKVGIQSNNTAALMNAGVTAAATAAGYAMLRFGQDSVKATTQLADSVRAVTQATGLSVERSSRLVAIFDDYGISSEAAAKSLSKFGRTIFDNSDALSEFGIQTAQTSTGQIDMERTLLRVADAYANITDPAARAALLNEAFGRTGRDLIPVLEQGRQGIVDLYAAVPDAQILSQEDLANARAYQLAVDNLNDVMMELQVTLGTELLPVLAESADSLANFARTVGRIGSFEVPVLNNSIFSLVSGFLDMMNPLGAVAGGLRDVGQFLGIGSDNADKDAEATKRNAQSKYDAALQTQRFAAEQEAANKAVQASIDLLYKQVNAQLGVEGAQINVTTATQKMNEVLNDGTATEIEKQKAVLDGKNAIDGYVTSLRAQAVAAGDATGGIQGQIDSLMFLKGTLDPASPLQVFLDSYIDKLRNQLPKNARTDIELVYVTRWTDPDTPPPFDWPGGADGNPETPYPMAKGGIVTRPTNALIGEAGPEAVIPLSRPNAVGMGTTINLVLDGRIITQVVRDDLIRIGRANGSALGRYA